MTDGVVVAPATNLNQFALKDPILSDNTVSHSNLSRRFDDPFVEII